MQSRARRKGPRQREREQQPPLAATDDTTLQQLPQTRNPNISFISPLDNKQSKLSTFFPCSYYYYIYQLQLLRAQHIAIQRLHATTWRPPLPWTCTLARSFSTPRRSTPLALLFFANCLPRVCASLPHEHCSPRLANAGYRQPPPPSSSPPSPRPPHPPPSPGPILDRHCPPLGRRL